MKSGIMALMLGVIFNLGACFIWSTAWSIAISADVLIKYVY